MCNKVLPFHRAQAGAAPLPAATDLGAGPRGWRGPWWAQPGVEAAPGQKPAAEPGLRLIPGSRLGGPHTSTRSSLKPACPPNRRAGQSLPWMERPVAAQRMGCKPPQGGQRHGGRAPPALGPPGPPDPHWQLPGSPLARTPGLLRVLPAAGFEGSPAARRAHLSHHPLPGCHGDLPLSQFPHKLRAPSSLRALEPSANPQHPDPLYVEPSLPALAPLLRRSISCVPVPAPSTPRLSDHTASTTDSTTCLLVQWPRHVTNHTDSPSRDVASSSAPPSPL